jgi:hypothetical protein
MTIGVTVPEDNSGPLESRSPSPRPSPRGEGATFPAPGDIGQHWMAGTREQ